MLTTSRVVLVSGMTIEVTISQYRILRIRFSFKKVELFYSINFVNILLKFHRFFIHEIFDKC